MQVDFLSTEQLSVAFLWVESSHLPLLGGNWPCFTLPFFAGSHKLTFYITPEQSIRILASEVAAPANATAKSVAVMDRFLVQYLVQICIHGRLQCSAHLKFLFE